MMSQPPPSGLVTDSCDAFGDELIHILPFLGALDQQERTSWSPETPPRTILFGQFGRAIIGAWPSLGAEQREALSSAIEAAAMSQDEGLGTAVLTGLVEAMLNAAQSDMCSEKDVLDFLGANARSYAVAWMKFYGCPTHGYS
jgi:hypothetical protein